MATEYQTISDEAEEDAVEARRPRRAGYDEGLAPSCMLWGTIIGLGGIIAVILVWIFSTGLTGIFQ